MYENYVPIFYFDCSDIDNDIIYDTILIILVSECRYKYESKMYIFSRYAG
jgi:hypothetical protein